MLRVNLPCKKLLVNSSIAHLSLYLETLTSKFSIFHNSFETDHNAPEAETAGQAMKNKDKERPAKRPKHTLPAKGFVEPKDHPALQYGVPHVSRSDGLGSHVSL